MKHLAPDKLYVRIQSDPCPRGDFVPRRYTLTHSDRTGKLFLTIGPGYDLDQIAGWTTRLMRDEILGDWLSGKNAHTLRVHCHVSGGLVLGKAAWREAILRRELPLVLEALRYGDRGLFAVHPELDRAPVTVHFHAARPDLDRVEGWGTMADYE